LLDATSQTPSFVAPGLKETTTLTFQVAVSDSLDTSLDTVDITVEAAPIVGGGACSIEMEKSSNASFFGGALLGLVALARRIRRKQG
jgi:hypothetical protein